MGETMASSSKQPAPARGASALPGCYIFALGAFLLVGVAIWAVYTFLHQAEELKAFTDEAPAPLEALAPEPAHVEALAGRLREFAAAGAAGQPAQLTLTPEDVNTLITGFDRLAELKSFIRVRRLGPDATFTADIRFPLNGLPGHRRYLNGELDGRFGLHPDAGLFVSALNVRVPGRTVPPGFIEVYQRGVIPGKNFGFLDDMLLRNFRDDPVFAAPLKQIATLASSEGTLVLTTKTTAKPAASANPPSNPPPGK